MSISEKSSWNGSCEALFLKRLSQYTRLKVSLKVNHNRSTMLNVLERRWRFVRLSLHQMFLNAPDRVVEAVAHYLKGRSRGDEEYHKILREYIELHLPKQDYSCRLPSVLKAEGVHYDLQAIYEKVNQDYFNQNLNLKVTWYGGTVRSKYPKRITFGLYEDPLKLIKINRILDDPFFPSYFVSYVVYHEMVHAVVPGEMNERGQFCVHTPLFKEHERQFADYKRAREWEKKNRNKIFSHGRT